MNPIRHLLPVVCVLCAVTLFACGDREAQPQQAIVGEWTIEYEDGQQGVITFREDDTGVQRIAGRDAGDEFRYDLDGSRDPAWLDFTLPGGNGRTLLGIVDFADENTARWAWARGPRAERPESVENAGFETALLRRTEGR